MKYVRHICVLQHYVIFKNYLRRILHECGAPVSTRSDCVKYKYNPPKAGPAYICVYKFVHQEGILLAHAYYIQLYRSRLGCYTIGPMYL